MATFKLKAAIIIGIAAVGGVIVTQHKTIQNLRSEKEIYQQNTISLMTGMEELKKDSTIQAYQISTLKLTTKEYEQYRQKDAQTIKDLNIKLKRIVSASKQQMEANIPISAKIIHDTTYIYPHIKLKNKYISFTGIIKKDTLDAEIHIPIRLNQIVYKIPKRKFLWWSWGVKGFKQIITTDNPYITLQYTEFINIQ